MCFPFTVRHRAACLLVIRPHYPLFLHTSPFTALSSLFASYLSAPSSLQNRVLRPLLRSLRSPFFPPGFTYLVVNERPLDIGCRSTAFSTSGARATVLQMDDLSRKESSGQTSKKRRLSRFMSVHKYSGTSSMTEMGGLEVK